MMTRWMRRLALDRILLVLALGLVASVLAAPRIVSYWSERTQPIHGQAKGHEEQPIVTNLSCSAPPIGPALGSVPQRMTQSEPP
jgi:hypothetical protein